MPARPALATCCIALFTALTLAGCGGSKTVRISSHELRLRLEEFRFVPQDVSVPAGRLKVVATNNGTLTHNVVIELLRRSVYGNHVVMASIPTLLPGQTSAPIKVLLPPGRYLMVSTISNQADLGMNGILTVRAGP